MKDSIYNGFKFVLDLLGYFVIASIIPLLVFGVFALLFVVIGSFPLYVWLIPTFLSVVWYFYFFTGID